MSDLFNRIQQAFEGRYEIEREIGRGGMGIVYLAADLKLRRQVAVKVLRPELAQAVGAERFLREVRIEASLDHPNIVALYDSGEADGLPYYVMPFIKGESLRHLIEREERLSLDEVVRITNGVAAGLSHAHANGVIHRDIKPENILLTDDRVLVADFGIAKATEEAGGEKLSTYGLVLGTPEYMSPEQAMDDRVDHRTDIYALGCVVYEMLSGDPPFTGRTRSAIIARHIKERVPSLDIVRADIPMGIVQAVGTALSKVAGDRFNRATDLADALAAGVRTQVVSPNGRRKRMVRRVALTSGSAVAAALVAIAMPVPDLTPLDANRIVGFPMVESGLAGLPRGIGEMVALGIGSALEETAPLQWVDGWLELDEDQRANAAVLTSNDKDRIARNVGARYRVDGSVVATGSSASVILWLHDVAADSMLGRKTVSGEPSDTAVMAMGIRAVRELLPVVLRPGRNVERVPLEDRDLAAVVLWMEGRREYRASHFRSALELYERAIGRDSALAMAALNAAQACSWLSELEQAEQFVNIALASEATLPVPEKFLARGLQAYLTGSTDSAVTWLRRALAADEDWAEAHMALGEVYYHLLPSGALALDSLAAREFEAALRDSLFSLPLYHLAEIAIRSGDLERGSELIERYRDFGPEDWILKQLSAMQQCVGMGPERMNWAQAVAHGALEALYAAKSLSAGGWQLPCAEGGFRAVMRDSSVRHLHWGAIRGLQSALLAMGRYEDYVALVDSVIGYRPPTWMLYPLAAIADSHLTSKAEAADAFIKAQFGTEYERSPTAGLRWTMAVWHAHRGETDLVRTLRNDLMAMAGDREARLYASALSAQLDFLEGARDQAISRLLQLASTGRRSDFEWSTGESLPAERMLLARLLFETERYGEALRVASSFDHTGPSCYPGFVPGSLALRYRAARAMGDRRLAEYYVGRLRSIGRGELIE